MVKRSARRQNCGAGVSGAVGRSLRIQKLFPTVAFPPHTPLTSQVTGCVQRSCHRCLKCLRCASERLALDGDYRNSKLRKGCSQEVVAAFVDRPAAWQRSARWQGTVESRRGINAARGNRTARAARAACARDAPGKNRRAWIGIGGGSNGCNIRSRSACTDGRWPATVRRKATWLISIWLWTSLDDGHAD